MIRTWVIFLLLFFVSHAFSETVKPSERFYSDTQYHLMLCDLRIRTAILEDPSGAKMFRELSQCRSEAESAAKKSYSKAIAATKKPAAISALKSYYAAWISAIRGVAPGVDEAKMLYNARQESTKSRLEELWAKFEIEQ